MKVLIRRTALRTVEQLAAYITDEIKMPATALAYTEKLIEFGMSLGKYYNAYPLCNDKKLLAQELYCATFDKKWVFVYRIGTSSVIIQRIVWGGNIK